MQVQIRESLITLVKAPFNTAYPGVPLVTDNMPFDRNKPPPQWVEFEIKWAGGSQVGMAARPKTRLHGWLYVTVWVKENTGSKTALTAVDWFNTQLGYAEVPGVHLQAPQPESVVPPKGWYAEQLKLYFYSDPA